MEELNARISALEGELGTQAGLDPLHDRFRVGAINAYRDLVNITFEEVNNGD